MPFRLRKTAVQQFTPPPEPSGYLRYWTPEPVGEVPPTLPLAELAAHRDVWSGTRDTDRRR